MLDENQRKELVEKIAYKNWQIRTIEKDERGEDNPILGYGSKETDFIKAVKIVSIFEGYDIEEETENIQDYLDLFGDILKNYFDKNYLYSYV